MNKQARGQVGFCVLHGESAGTNKEGMLVTTSCGLVALVVVLGTALALGSVVSAATEPAAPILTLDACIAEAIGKSQELAAIRARITAAEAMVRPAGALPDPMVSAGYQNIPVDAGLRLNQDTMSSFALMASQEVPPSSQRRAMRAVQSDMALMLRATHDDARNDLVRKVKQAYIDIQYRDQNLEIARRNRDLAKDMQASAEARYSTGKVMQQDVFQSQVRLTQMLDMIVMQQRERAMAASRLNRLLYRAQSEPIPPLPPLRRSDVQLATADELRTLTLQVSPQLREMRTRITQAADSERVAALGIRPMITYSVAYMIRQQVGADPMSGTDMWSASVGVTLPWLYRRDKVDEEVRSARAQQQAAADDLEAMQNELSAMVEETIIDIGRADEQLSLLQTGLLPQAEGAYAASRSSYVTGKGEVLDMLEAQMNLYDLELQQAMLLMQRERSLADLEYIVGGSLTAQPSPSEVSGEE